jgi:hypothetical protein
VIQQFDSLAPPGSLDADRSVFQQPVEVEINLSLLFARKLGIGRQKTEVETM